MIYVGLPVQKSNQAAREWLKNCGVAEGPDTWFTCRPDGSDIYQLNHRQCDRIYYGYVFADPELALAFKLRFLSENKIELGL